MKWSYSQGGCKTLYNTGTSSQIWLPNHISVDIYIRLHYGKKHALHSMLIRTQKNIRTEQKELNDLEKEYNI